MSQNRILEISGPSELAQAAKEYLTNEELDAVHVHSLIEDSSIANLVTASLKYSPASNKYSDEVQEAFSQTTKVVADWVRETKFGGLVLEASLNPAEFIRGERSTSPAHIDPRIMGRAIDYFAGPLTMSLGFTGEGRWQFLQAPHTLDKDANFSVSVLNSIIKAMKQQRPAPTSSLIQSPTDLVMFRGIPHPMIHGVNRLSATRASGLYDYRFLELPLIWQPNNPVVPGSALKEPVSV